MTGFIGAVCGLKSEAAAIARAAPSAALRVAVTGADAQRAETLAAALIAEGARAILSVGVSGGLDPALRPGDLVIGDAVVTGRGEAFRADPALVAALAEAAPEARKLTFFGADEIIAGAAEKAELFARFAAAAVDMESHGAARAAANAGVPFAALRAIADPADRVLPKAALGAVAPDGSTRVLATLLRCAKAPGDFPALLALGRDSNAALRSLSGGLGRLFPGLLLRLDL